MRTLVLVVALALASCGGPTATATPSVEVQLALINGDPLSAAEFRRILDDIQAGTAICAPEPNRLRIADSLVASWEIADRPVTLLEWARLAASVCSE